MCSPDSWLLACRAGSAGYRTVCCLSPAFWSWRNQSCSYEVTQTTTILLSLSLFNLVIVRLRLTSPPSHPKEKKMARRRWQSSEVASAPNPCNFFSLLIVKSLIQAPVLLLSHTRSQDCVWSQVKSSICLGKFFLLAFSRVKFPLSSFFFNSLSRHGSKILDQDNVMCGLTLTSWCVGIYI